MAAAVVPLTGLEASAKPRPARPPIPEATLFQSRFDTTDAWLASTNPAVAASNLNLAESWSGYALDMLGRQPRLFQFPVVKPDGRLNLSVQSGTVRFWFAPAWSSASAGGVGPRSDARLFEVGQLGRPSGGGWALHFSRDGTAIQFTAQAARSIVSLLEAPIAWHAREWHQVALVYGPEATALYLDGRLAAEGRGVVQWARSQDWGRQMMNLGSDAAGGELAQGQFEEFATFAYPCRAEQIAGNFQWCAGQARLGPISQEEEAQRLASRAAATLAAGTEGMMTMTLLQEPDCPSDCTSLKVAILPRSDGTLKLCVCGAQAGARYDVFYSPSLNEPVVWTWVGRGAAGQTQFPLSDLSIGIPDGPLGYFRVGTMQDTDHDGLTDAYETLVSGTDPNTPSRVDTDGDGLLDAVEMQIGTNPCFADTDGDGLPDGYEVAIGLNPLVDDASQDLDQDGVSNLAEHQNHTNPTGTRESLGPCSRRTDWVISEIMYQPTGGDNYEFVEFYNASLISQDLAGFGMICLPSAGGAPVASYTFPANTVVPSGGFLLLAKAPGSFPSVSTVVGPYTGSLPNGSGIIQLTNRWGAILLEVPYSSQTPWPVAAAGGGHSLVLARPSYGEGNPSAWAASDQIGGSPGRPDFMSFEPARAVVINEFRANATSDSDRFIELYNHSNGDVNLDGYALTDGPAGHSYVFPANTKILARSFVSRTKTQLGANFSLTGSGSVICLRNQAGTRLVDSVAYGPQESGQVMGRYPDGAPTFHELTGATAGSANTANNTALRIRDIVINEIMYNPIFGDEDFEYVELYNRGSAPVSIGGWTLGGKDGMSAFVIPSGKNLVAGGYLVLAHNAVLLGSKHTSDLTTNGLNANCIGPVPWHLSNKGQRLSLTNSDGVLMDEVTYCDGGQWGRWSDGGGSSLELIDSNSDNRLPSNWGDSDERNKASTTWDTVTVTGPLADGDGRAESQNEIKALEIILLGEGECLVDNVQVRKGNGDNLVANSTFETGVTGWTMEGSHDLSDWEPSVANGGLGGYLGGRSLHLRAGKGGDYLANRISVGLGPTIPTSYAGDVTITAKVRWLRGHPEIVLRLRGNYLEASGVKNITVPTSLGSPGKKNSIAPATPNTGPAIFAVSHEPILPDANQDVVVTARFHDPNGIAVRHLVYRIDPESTIHTVTMTDDGQGGDAVAGDGVFSAKIQGSEGSGMPVGTLVAFHIESSDNSGASSRFPTARVMYPGDTEQRECLIRYGEVRPSGAVGTYRLWMTLATHNKWANRSLSASGRSPYHKGNLDCTFVYGGERVVYTAGGRFAGSSASCGQYGTPTTDDGGFTTSCGYGLDLPSDDRFLGSSEVGLPHPNRPFFDPDLQKEQVMAWLADQMGVPANHRRFVRLFVNGVERGRSGFAPGESNIYEDVCDVGSEMLDSWFSSDSNGDLFKMELWWRNAQLPVGQDGLVQFQCTLDRFPDSGAINQTRYRWNWMKRAVDASANDYGQLFALVEMANTAHNGPNYTAQMDAVVDAEQWMRTFAFERVINNRDGYSVSLANCHNMYAYKPPNGRWLMLPSDLETGIFNGCEDPILTENVRDNRLQHFIENPRFQRALWRGLKVACEGDLLTTRAQSIVDAYHQALGASQINLPVPTFVAGWLTPRLSYLQNRLATVAASFDSTSGGTTTQNPVVVAGTAPVTVTEIRVNNVPYPVTWTDVTHWEIRVPLTTIGANNLTVRAYDRIGNQVGNHVSLAFTYTGAYLPENLPYITEVMAKNDTVLEDPADGQHDDWIEIHNAGPTVMSFGGYRLKKTKSGESDVVWTVPDGTSIPPGGFLLVWADNETKQNGRYGPGTDLHASFKLSDGYTMELWPASGDMLDSVAIGTATSDVSRARSLDRKSSSFASTTTPTPRRPNVITPP